MFCWKIYFETTVSRMILWKAHHANVSTKFSLFRSITHCKNEYLPNRPYSMVTKKGKSATLEMLLWSFSVNLEQDWQRSWLFWIRSEDSNRMFQLTWNFWKLHVKDCCIVQNLVRHILKQDAPHDIVSVFLSTWNSDQQITVKK